LSPSRMRLATSRSLRRSSARMPLYAPVRGAK
jgi:hypothetical protein